MSTLKANAINNISASVGGITIDSSGTVSGSLPSPNRNLLYNGAMQIHQRSASVTGITGSGYNTADRWLTSATSIGTWTQTIENDAPTGSGFRKSLRMLCTTADSAPASTDALQIIQYLEGQDLQRVAKGTASAKQLTLSFWVKSSTTGTYVAELNDNDNGRFSSFTYTINQANTWEKEVITFPADTTGVLDNDNNLSFFVRFWLASGSAYTTGAQQSSWVTTSSNLTSLAPSQINLAAATNNYWQITGVQLETGNPTEFEFKSFGQDLRECQRYYYQITTLALMGSVVTSAIVLMPTRHPVTMRISPQIIQPANLTDAIDLPAIGTRTPTALALYGGGGTAGSVLNFGGMTGLTVGAPAVFNGATIGMSAEL